MAKINYEFYGAGTFRVDDAGKKKLIDKKTTLTGLKYEINPLLEKKIVGIRKLNYNNFTEFVFITPSNNYKLLVDNTQIIVLSELNTLVEAIKQSNERIKKRGARKNNNFKIKFIAAATIAAIAVGGFVLVKNNKKINQYVTSKIITQLEKDRLANDNDALEDQLYYQNSMDQEADKSR